MTTFKRRQKVELPIGSKQSVNYNSLIMVSSGLKELDEIFGGGFPVGSVVVIEEESSGFFHKPILRCFLTEGFRNGNISVPIFKDVDEKKARSFLLFDYSHHLKEGGIEIHREKEENASMCDPEVDLKIAFRYKEFIHSEIEKKKSRKKRSLLGKSTSASIIKCNEYDIAKCLQDDLYERNKDVLKVVNVNTMDFKESLSKLSGILEKATDEKKIARVVIQNVLTTFSNFTNDEIIKFFYVIKCLMRNNLAVCMLSVPKKCEILQNLKSIGDLCVSLSSFKDDRIDVSDMENLKDYSGFFVIEKLTRMNSICPNYIPKTMNFVFVLKNKRKLLVEEIHDVPITSFGSGDDKKKTNENDF